MYFSIVVPVYNVEKYLDDCVTSVLSQSFCDFELILVDDGSKDQSGAICDAYAEKDARVKVLHKENGGQSTARNRGVEAASGKYVLFLDSDDMFSTPDCLQLLFDKTQDDPDIVAFGYCKYFSETEISKQIGDFSELDHLDFASLLYQLVKRDAFFCSCWSKTVKRDLLVEHGIAFDEALSCEDMDWYFNVVLAAKSIRAINRSFVYYRQREGSVTSGFKPKALRDYITTIHRWRTSVEAMPESLLKQALLSALAKLYCNLLISYARNKKRAPEFQKDIVAHKALLQYDLNPRTAKIKSLTKLFGLKGTLSFLHFIDKVR